jgi:hypothetical protein
MLKTMSAKEREARYALRNPREIKPFTREAAKTVGNEAVRMK